ncbi:hypothetical protein L218DRAFT_961689, partial [Marasmius fiardii PR-910]
MGSNRVASGRALRLEANLDQMSVLGKSIEPYSRIPVDGHRHIRMMLPVDLEARADPRRFLEMVYHV